MSLRNQAKLNCPPELYVPPPPTLYPPQIPRAHQLEALDGCRKGFLKGAVGRLHMPCGTGKTLVGMWTAKTLGALTMLVVVPSIGLLKQTLFAWKQNAPFKFAHLAVCHDKEVDDDIACDELLDYTTVTRDVSEIVQFISGAGVRVVFSTYASADRCGYGSNVSKGFDLVIADEAHHLGSARDDAHAAPFRLPNRLNAKCVLYMTATPYRLHNFPEIFGPVFYQLQYLEAVARGLLCPLRTVVPITFAKSVPAFLATHKKVAAKLVGQKIPADELVSHILVILAARDFKLRRMASFHHRIIGASTFALRHMLVADAMHQYHGTSKVTCDYISGDMKLGLRELKLARMRCNDAYVRLLASARCINEGCDIPPLDGAIFVDPKNSVESVIQCAGRTGRLSPGKTDGTIMLPVLLTDADVKDFTLGDVPDGHRYSTISTTLQAMMELNPSIAVAMQEARVALAKGEKNVQLPPDIVLHTVGGVLLPPNFLAQFRTAILRSTADVWAQRHAQLAAYAAQHGLEALDHDESPEAVRMRKWAGKQVTDYNAAKALPDAP